MLSSYWMKPRNALLLLTTVGGSLIFVLFIGFGSLIVPGEVRRLRNLGFDVDCVGRGPWILGMCTHRSAACVNNNFDDADAARLGLLLPECRELFSLSIDHTEITDAGLLQISAGTQVRLLILAKTKVSTDGVARFLAENRRRGGQIYRLDVRDTAVTLDGSESTNAFVRAMSEHAPSGSRVGIDICSRQVSDRVRESIKIEFPSVSLYVHADCE